MTRAIFGAHLRDLEFQFYQRSKMQDDPAPGSA